jgi:hypothetical protein
MYVPEIHRTLKSVLKVGRGKGFLFLIHVDRIVEIR